MSNMSRKLFITAALAFMLCLAGLVLSGTAFAQQCVDNGDGTVTDNATGLMWQKATANLMTWDTAMSYASSLSLGDIRAGGCRAWMNYWGCTIRRANL